MWADFEELMHCLCARPLAPSAEEVLASVREQDLCDPWGCVASVDREDPRLAALEGLRAFVVALLMGGALVLYAAGGHGGARSPLAAPPAVRTVKLGVGRSAAEE